MFSFHKPRVYRSTEGCCICRAKSSSSRFTDSRKYEEDSIKCFNLNQPRYGEICNACVLLVKRYKRLPAGSQRHWGHVVDARAGPGTKTFTKLKRNKEENTNDSSNTGRSNHIHNGKTLITEKFSKIFKKTKKLKSMTLVQNPISKSNSQKSPPRMRGKMKLTQRQDSVDSDNENSRESSPGSSGSTAAATTTTTQTTVQFQTQTRASSYRMKNFVKSQKTSNEGPAEQLTTVKQIQKLSGSKRRKKLPPQKNRQHGEKDISFFDNSEWLSRLKCCNAIHECENLGGAILIDLEPLNNCREHQHSNLKSPEKSISLSKSNCIKATLPAVVKINVPTTTSNVNHNPTPVLKKHHLFFKRQSECFPLGDLTSESSTTTTNSINSKTEICMPTTAKSLIDSTTTMTTTTQIQNVEKISTISPTKNANCIMETISNTSKNSTAKITAISAAPVSFEAPYSASNIKSSGFLHKIKADAGKIVKHSISKLNSAVRLKAHDLAELKHIVKTVDKSTLLLSATTKTLQQQQLQQKTLEVPLPTSLSASSTKFSDNSSDSGFDENVHDRKSVSPLQQENDNKLNTRPAIQTLILSGGQKAIGQQHNLVYAGNETSVNILQGRPVQKQNIISSTVLQSNKHFNMQPTTTNETQNSIKLVHAKGNKNYVPVSAFCIGGTKMRTIYNNNAIQHENGITTILPASSFAATSQTAAMQASVPNTITITPALTMQKRISTNQISTNKYFYDQPPNEDSNNHHHQQQQQQYIKNTNLNQKFIVLKANTTPTITATNFGHNNNSDVMSNVSK